MPELIWDGKYDKGGRRTAPLRVPLPFQTVETVNESTQERQLNLERLHAAETRLPQSPGFGGQQLPRPMYAAGQIETRCSAAAQGTSRHRGGGTNVGALALVTPLGNVSWRNVELREGVIADEAHPRGDVLEGVDQPLVGCPKLGIDHPGKDHIKGVIHAAEVVRLGKAQRLLIKHR